MKMNRVAFLALMVPFFLTACDYFGEFKFTIDNQTDSTVTISYFEQYQGMEDVLPTYDHGDDYEYIRISTTDSVCELEPYKSCSFSYGAGLVSRKFPTLRDTPEVYNISPLWDRINYVLVGSDTLPPTVYTKEKWNRSGSTYSLRLVLDD